MQAYPPELRRSRAIPIGLSALGLGVALMLPTLWAQEPGVAPLPLDVPDRATTATPPPTETTTATPAPAETEPEDLDLGRVALADEPATAPVPRVSYHEAGVKPGELAEPGTTVELDIRDEASGGASSFRWVQVEGPAVTIADPSQRAIEVEVPDGAERLAFLRIATAPGEVRIVRFVVPVRSSVESSAPPAPVGPLRADAGDDQVGLVGHRVTLNGSRSQPAEGVVYRWLQVGGPPIVAPQQERAFFSFVPTGPGLYQFALVIGGSRAISEADTVSVLVGAAPAGSGLAPGVGASAPYDAPAAPAPPPPASPTPESLVASALPRLADGPRLAGEVADVFDAVADRASLYSTFGDLQSELSRRLDVVIPLENDQRLAWSQGVLQPLTLHTIQQMLAIGLDVRQQAGLNQPLTPGQRERVRAHFHAMARAFRDASSTTARQ